MTALDALLDRTNPIADGDESWSDREFGVVYCQTCGAEADLEERGRLVSRWRCETSVCDTTDGIRLTHPMLYSLTAAVASGSVMLALGVAGHLSVLTMLLVWLAIAMGVWRPIYRRVGR